MTKNAPILADMASDPKKWVDMISKSKRLTPTAMSLKTYEKIVLDDEAIKIATDLSHQGPKLMLSMVDVAVPPFERMWIEWHSAPYLKLRADFAIENGADPSKYDVERPAHAKMALVVTRHEDFMRIRCIEHDDECEHLFEWPICYDIAFTGEVGHFDHRREVNGYDTIFQTDDKKANLDQIGLLWGYHSSMPKLKKLHLKSRAVIEEHQSAIYGFNSGVNNAVAVQLQGLTRMAVAILSLLNTSMVIDEPTRPTGRLMGISGSRPHSSRRIATLTIPQRIRNKASHALKVIKDESDRIKRRLHHVSGHYRHMRHKPVNGEGWVPCHCPAREAGQYWHKHVDDFWRGDETLGIVEREYTLVKGRAEA